MNIHETLREEAFAAWLESPDDKHHVVSDASNTSPYALHTFETTWAFIQALNKLTSIDDLPSMATSSCSFDNILHNRQPFLQNLISTYFTGVSGIVHFPLSDSNDRVDDAAYTLDSLKQPDSENPTTWT